MRKGGGAKRSEAETELTFLDPNPNTFRDSLRSSQKLKPRKKLPPLLLPLGELKENLKLDWIGTR